VNTPSYKINGNPSFGNTNTNQNLDENKTTKVEKFYYSNNDDFDDDDFNEDYEKNYKIKNNYVSNNYQVKYETGKINTSKPLNYCDSVFLGNSKYSNNKVCV